MKKIIFFLFAFLFFFVPLILWPFTSEVFEFNKMVLVYILTVLISGAWLTRCIIERKIIFRRTILDIPLLVFIGSQLISTLISIDPLTSLLGYYSRFNGGLLSTICYSLLYWAFVSNLDKKEALRSLYSLPTSAVLVSIYGVLEHFGIDKNIWVQDVQSRVFSTLGQPNWLAAFLVALIPLTWNKSKIYYLISTLFFITLLFTGSRSGLLGLVAASVIYWGSILIKYKKEYLKEFFIYNLIFVILFLIIQAPFTFRQVSAPTNAPALETGGTESGVIRQIVWKGAIEIWKHYPIFGTGVETFAYSYPMFRPVEHNLVSEWDFIYNKAHNEYLNLAANTGSFGLLSYLILLGFSIFVFIKNENYAFLAGYVSLLITNFFGFSVVPTQLLLFLFPALAIAMTEQSAKDTEHSQKIGNTQKIAVFFVLCTMLYVLSRIATYWYSDILYNKGKIYNSSGKPDLALKYLKKAISLEPNQPLFHNEIAGSYALLKQADLAISQSQKATDLSPNNPNLIKSQFGIYIMLSSTNPNYLILARDTLTKAIDQSPTDAKLYYNLALTLARTKDTENAIKILEKTIELKSNYKEARLAYALLLINKGQNVEAKKQLEYILKNIDPKDDLTKQTFEGIK